MNRDTGLIGWIVRLVIAIWLLWVLSQIAGCICDGPLLIKNDRDLIQSKLNSITAMEGQLGAMVGYTNMNLNSPMYGIERWYQVNQNLIPKTQIDFQKLMKARSYMKGKYNYE